MDQLLQSYVVSPSYSPPGVTPATSWPPTATTVSDHEEYVGLQKWLISFFNSCAQERRLARRLGPGAPADPARLRALWTNEIPTAGKGALYTRLFASSGLRKQSVFDNPLGPPLSSSGLLVRNHLKDLRRLLGVQEADVLAVLDEESESAALDIEALSVATVTMLLRYDTLARGLRVSIPDLIRARQLITPRCFASVDRDVDRLGSTIQFVEAVRLLQASGVGVEDWAYVVSHTIEKDGKYRLADGIPEAQYKALIPRLEELRGYLPAAELATPAGIQTALRNYFPASIARRLFDAVTGETTFSAGKTTFRTWATGESWSAGELCVNSGNYYSCISSITLSTIVPGTDSDHFAAVATWTTIGTYSKGEVVVDGDLWKCISGGAVVGTHPSADPGKWEKAVARLSSAAFSGNSHFSAEPALKLSYEDGQDRLSWSGLLLASDRIAGLKNSDHDGDVGISSDQRTRLNALIDVLVAASQKEMDALWPGMAALVPATQAEVADTLGKVDASSMVAEFARGQYERTHSRTVLADSLAASTGSTSEVVQLLLDIDDPLSGASHAEGGGPRQDESLVASWSLLGQRGVAVLCLASDGRVLEGGASVVEKATTTGLTVPAGTAAIRFQGFFEPIYSGTYRLDVSTTTTGLTAVIVAGAPPVRSEVANPATSSLDDNGPVYVDLENLQAGSPVPWSLTLRGPSFSSVRLRVRSPISADAFAAFPDSSVIARPHRSAHVLTNGWIRLVSLLGLDATALRDFKARGFRYFPAPAAFEDQSAAFEPLFALAALKRERGVAIGEILDTLQSLQERTADPTPTVSNLTDRLAVLVNRPADRVAALATALGATVEVIGSSSPTAYRLAGLTEPQDLYRFWRALDLTEQLGTPANDLKDWVTPSARTSGHADAARDAVQRRLGADWVKAAPTAIDEHRRRRRDALIAYLTRNPAHNTPELLFEYLLLDPLVEPVVEASRVQLAISSVQLFIQRCLLGQEDGMATAGRQVHPSAIDGAKWEWMKRYRLWEASRRIFLFPENWLDPELRDDRSAAFSQLERTLLASTLTEDTVAEAFHEYLRDVEEVARLELISAFVQEDAEELARTNRSDVLHLLGRAASSRNVFYRRYSHGEWSPWEPLNAPAIGDHVALTIWEGRPTVFWLTPCEQPKPADIPLDKTPDRGAPSTKSDFVFQVNWMQRGGDSKWTTMGALGVPLAAAQGVPAGIDIKAVSIHVDLEADGRLVLNLGGALRVGISLANRYSPPRRADYGEPRHLPFEHLTGDASLLTSDPDRPVTLDLSYTESEGPADSAHLGHWRMLSGVRDGFTVLSPANKQHPDDRLGTELLRTPVFYQDDSQTLFVEASFQRQEASREAVPVVQQTPPVPPPTEYPLTFSLAPFYPAIDRVAQRDYAAMAVVARGDWLTDARTLLHFGDASSPALIGPRGHFQLTTSPGLEGGLGLTGGRAVLQAPGQPAVVAQQSSRGTFTVVSGTIDLGGPLAGGDAAAGHSVKLVPQTGLSTVARRG